MQNILSRSSGISTLKSVFRNIENSLRNRRKTPKIQEFTHSVFCQYLGTCTIFSNIRYTYIKIKGKNKDKCTKSVGGGD